MSKKAKQDFRTQISINLNFGGVVLPVIQNGDGYEVVPFKPIVEMIGLDYMSQYRRMQTPYLTRRLGTCIGGFPYAGQQREMVGIRVDRVTAYLNTINPDQVRGNGNIDAADFLEQKHAEWDDVLHAYESSNGIFSADSNRRTNDTNKVINMMSKIAHIPDPDIKAEALRHFDGLTGSNLVGSIARTSIKADTPSTEVQKELFPVAK